jgi:hypothetical protein
LKVKIINRPDYKKKGTRKMSELPVARQKDLVVEELPDEVLVYDLRTDEAHCLNQTAALIWKNCDGQKSVGEIAALVEQELKSPVSEQVVMLGLEELSVYRLLTEKTWEAPTKARLSRRELVKKLGLTAAIGLPIIISITAPTAAQAATVDPCVAPSGRPEGCPCSNDNECASFNCNAGTCGPALRPSRQ